MDMLMLVAAERRELKGLLRFCTRVAERDCAAGWCRSAELNGEPIVMVANGVGAGQAARAVDAAMSAGVHAVVSAGYCGALDPGLKIAEVFVATTINGLPISMPASERPHRAGALLSIDRVAATAEQKRNLRAGGASVVEMEAAGVAERARSAGLPLYCVRSVTDLAGESFHVDFEAALRADGHFDTMQILRSAIRRPTVCFPELVRLRNRCEIASRTLGEFLADCRF
jgi:adenosylhomocysteine nucleosidase